MANMNNSGEMPQEEISNDVTSSSKRNNKRSHGPRSKRSSDSNRGTNSKSTEVSSLNLVRNMDSQLMQDVTNFPFAGAVGRTIDVASTTFTDNPLVNYEYTVPGICAFSFYPAVGQVLEFNSALNLAMRNLYSFVTHANSRNASYQPTDLMLYILAVSNLFTMWNNGVRAYGIAKQYSATNRYLAETLIQACGFNPHSLLFNLNDFRGALNVLASKLSSLVIPSSIGYTLHTFNMCSEVYADSESSRAQLYLFRPAAYWYYDETANETGGSLVTKPIADDKLFSAEEYINIINSMSNSILGSKYMNVMAADIMKAFGSNLYSLSEIPADYTVTPKYSDAILETINNIRIIGKPVEVNNRNSNDVYQNIPTPESGESPYLIYAPVIQGPKSRNYVTSATAKVWLNTNYESLSPAQVIDRTNYSAWLSYFGGTTTADQFMWRIHPRTEIIVKADIYFSPYNGENNTANRVQFSGNTFSFSLLSDTSYLRYVTAFNKFPMFWEVSEDSTSILGIFGDVDNIAFIDLDDMRALDETIMQIIFNVDTVFPGK